MVEVQACGGLVNVSLLAIEEDNGEGVGDAALLSVALQRERRRNSELMEKITVLEDRIKTLDRYAKCSCNTDRIQRRFNEFQRQEANCAMTCHTLETGINNVNVRSQLTKNNNARDAYCISDDKADDHDKDKENKAPGIIAPQLHHKATNNMELLASSLTKGSLRNQALVNTLSESVDAENVSQSCAKFVNEVKEYDGKQISTEDTKDALDVVQIEDHCRNMAWCKKSPKVAFSPKEVKRITELDTLLQKNAQSHTIRKIIAFSSLGTRHGCDDMLQLDFSHFRIVKTRKSTTTDLEDQEHVLYENPGVRTKILYPNKENPTLCPVQILEEEKMMRPSDESCPSCLFLCIKYGGRTRNLPQNEYVRQKMGRNKMKSFGPTMCEMAMLVHIRSGKFFFKALGVTLLFMAGFSDDKVQKETSYRTLDSLQKYYRKDAETEGHELFLQHGVASNIPSPKMQQPTDEKASKRLKSKKQVKSDNYRRVSKTKLQPYHSSQPASSLHPPADSLQLLTAPSPSQFTQTNGFFMPMIYWPPTIAYPLYNFPMPASASTKNYFVSPQSYLDNPKSTKPVNAPVKPPEKCCSQSNSNSSRTRP